MKCQLSSLGWGGNRSRKKLSKAPRLGLAFSPAASWEMAAGRMHSRATAKNRNRRVGCVIAQRWRVRTRFGGMLKRDRLSIITSSRRLINGAVPVSGRAWGHRTSGHASNAGFLQAVRRRSLNLNVRLSKIAQTMMRGRVGTTEARRRREIEAAENAKEYSKNGCNKTRLSDLSCPP